MSAKTAKIATVNVIEYRMDTIRSLKSFRDNDNGNKEAEELFKKLAIKNGADNLDVDSYIEDGFFGGVYGYQLFLTHSA